MHRKRRKTYCRSKKNIFRNDEKYVLSRYKHEKMFGILDEKYSPGNMLAKKLLCLQTEHPI
jgi:hypothetical protein